MESNSPPETWDTAISGIYEQMSNYLVAYLPHLLGALLLIVAGWLAGIILA